MRNKDNPFIRHGTVVIGLNKIGATLVSTRKEKVVGAKATTTLVEGKTSFKTVNKFDVIAFGKIANTQGFAVKAA